MIFPIGLVLLYLNNVIMLYYSFPMLKVFITNNINNSMNLFIFIKKIINKNGKYIFKVEIWKQRNNLIYIPATKRTLFLIKVNKY